MYLTRLSVAHPGATIDIRATLILVAALTFGSATWAAEETWIGPSGNWSEDSKWLDGTAPLTGGDPNLTLQFTRGGSTTNDLGAFQLNRLRFEPILSGTLTVASAPGGSLILGGQQPMVEALNIGDSIISSPMTLSPASGDVSITGSRSGTLTVSGAIGEGGSARKLVLDSNTPSVSAGLVALTGTNSFTGGVLLRRGNVTLQNANALGTGPLEVHGGTLRLDLGVVRSLSNTISLHNNLVIASADGATLSGTISEATPGVGLFLRNRASTLFLSAPATYTGPTVIDYAIVPSDSTGAGGLHLSGNGAVLNSSSIEVRAGGRFSSTSNGGSTNRIGDSTPMNLRSGMLTFSGNAAAEAQTETIGALNGAGFSTMTVLANATGGSTRLLAASLNRLERGTFLVRGSTLGGAFTSGTANFLVGTAPSGLVGGGGTGASTSILPYMIGATSSGGAGDTFVTWEATTGFRPLDTTSDYGASLSIAGPAENVRITGGAQTLSGSQTINSLLLASGGSINGGGTLTLTSGALLAAANTTLDVNLAFGTAEANISNLVPLTIGRTISGSNGLTKSGSATLTLSGANTFTGPLTVNAGLVSFTNPENLGAGNSPITFGGTGAGLIYAGTTFFTLDRDLILGSGISALSITAQAPRVTLSGTISGLGGLSLAAPSRFGPNFEITGANTYTGPTMLGSSVRILIGSDAALGNGGPVVMGNGSQIILGAPWQTTRELSLTGFASVDTAGFSAMFNGIISGNAPFVKTGAGTMRLTQSSPLRGTLTVSVGRLELGENGTISSSNVRVSRGAELTLDNSLLAVSQRLGTGSISVTGGSFNVLGNSVAAIRQAATSLAVGDRSRLTLTAPGAGQTLLSLGKLVLAQSITTPTLLVRGDNLGGGPDGAFTRVMVDTIVPFTQAPTGFGFVPGVYIADGAGSSAGSFAINDLTTDAAGKIGLRAFRPAEYTTGVIRNPVNGGMTPTAAHYLVASDTSASGGANTVATLTFEPSGNLSLAPDQTLLVDAGRLLARAGGPAGTIIGGALVLGSASPTIYTAGDLRIDSGLSTGAMLLKVGAGALILGGAPAVPAFAVQEGTLRAGGNLAVAAGMTLSSGGVLDVAGQSMSIGMLGNDAAGAGEVILGGGVLTLGMGNHDSSFSGAINGSGRLVIEGGLDGKRRHTLLGTNSFTGGITLSGGRLSINSNSALGTGPITAAGGTLASTSNVTLGNAFVLNEDLPIAGASVITLAPTSSISGTGGIEFRGSGTLVISAASAHTGETSIASTHPESGNAPGTVTVNGASGAVAASSALRVGGTLILDNTAALTGGAAGRVGDNTPVRLHGGLLRLVGNAFSDTTETIGPLSGTGFSRVNLQTPAATGTRLNSAALIREARGTFVFGGVRLGDPPGAGVSNMLFAQAPSGLVGGGGTGPATSILPYAVAGVGTDTQLVTYDVATGIRPLTFSEYRVNNFSAGTENVRITGSTMVGSAVSANALVLSGGGLDGVGEIQITSGTVMKTPFGLSPTIANPVAFGAAEANVFVYVSILSPRETLTLSGPVSGSAGLTKSGSGTLALTSANSFTGPLTLNDGTLEFLSLAALGPETSPIVSNGGLSAPALRYIGTTPVTFVRELHSGSGVLRLSARSTMTVAGDITGPGGVFVEVQNPADAFIQFAGAKSYTGPTVIAGPLAISSDDELGEGGSVILGPSSAARLRLDAPWDTSREIYVGGFGLLFDSNGFDAVWRGPLRSDPATGGGFTKLGAGTLTITDASNYTGGLTVAAGTLHLESPIGAAPEMIIEAAGRLSGSERITGSVQVRGTLAPGADGIGTITTNGISFSATSTFEIELRSAASYDRVAVTGSVNIASGANLSLELGFDPVDFVDAFQIVENDDTDFVISFPSGFAFGGKPLAEGETFVVDAQEFKITYAGGTGNDVVLHAVPEPNVTGIAAGLFFVAGCSRRRNGQMTRA